MTIKKRSQSLSCGLSPVRIYLDDIEEIHGVIAAACKRVELLTDNEVLDRPDELAQLGVPRLRELQIRGYEPYISLTIRRRFGAFFYAENRDDSQLRGAFERVKEILIGRRRLLFAPFSSWRPIAIATIVLFLLSNAPAFFLPPKTYRIVGAFILGLYLCFVIVLVWFVARPTNVINLARRKDARPSLSAMPIS